MQKHRNKLVFPVSYRDIEIFLKEIESTYRTDPKIQKDTKVKDKINMFRA